MINLTISTDDIVCRSFGAVLDLIEEKTNVTALDSLLNYTVFTVVQELQWMDENKERVYFSTIHISFTESIQFFITEKCFKSLKMYDMLHEIN